ncbi:MAG: DsrE family protein [Candidatus Bathyarchaeota archaeon]|nr:MAG: DsrE family protein [Candidatus Bathyarchaeota archaeon]
MAQTKMAWIINDPSYDRVLYALTVAAMSSARFNDVKVLFTYGAVLRLVRGKTDDVGEETRDWIRENIRFGRNIGVMKSISEMIALFKGFGGKLYACSASLAFHNLTQENLLEEVDDVIGIATFLDRTEGGTMLYV